MDIDKTMKTKVLSRLDRESVAILTFERPTKLNALNYELVDSIVHALERIEEEKHIRAVVLTGSGRAFSAGADVHEFSKDVGLGPQAAYRRFVRRGQNMTRRIENFSKPIIAAVNGLAYGGGCEIVEATHLSIAAPEAVEVCIHAVQRGLNTTIDEGLAIEAEAFGKMVSTAALRQGLDDFIAA